MKKWFLMVLLVVAGLKESAYAQTQIVADVTELGSGAYWYSATDITYLTGGVGTAFGGSGSIICFEHNADTPPDTVNRIYTVTNASNLFQIASGAATGESLLYWLYDNYYADIFNNPGNPNYLNSNDFQRAVWELAADYDGALTSIDLYTGDYWPEVGNDMITNLMANYASISSGYTSSSYQFHYLSDNEGGYQNMLLVTSVAVPEPGSAFAIALAGVCAILRRRRY